MPDLIIPPAAVQNPTASPKQADAAVAIAAGQTIVVVNGSATLAVRTAAGLSGIAVASAEIGQKILYVSAGALEIQGLLAQGETYAVGSVPGSMAPLDELGSGHFVNYVATGVDGDNADLGIMRSTGVAKP